MIVVTPIRVDLQKRRVREALHAVQNDSNTRGVKLLLYEGDTPWKVPGGVTAFLSFRKPDNTVGLYDTLPDGSAAIKIDDNIITAILAPQVLTSPGAVYISVTLQDANTNRLSTFPLIVHVAEDPSAEGIPSETYVNMVQWMLDEVDKRLQELLAQGVQDDLDLRGNAIDNIGSLALTSGKGDGNGVWAQVGNTYPSEEGGVFTELSLYGFANDESVILNNIAPGVEDRDAANVGQLKTRLIAPIKAAVGQYIQITAVDENGAVTAVEAVDAPSGGGLTKVSQLENDSDYAPRSELPKAFYVEYFDGELNKSLAEIGEAYKAGSVVFGAFAFSEDDQFTAIMTYYVEEDGFIAALFNGWGTNSIKRQIVIQISDDGSGVSVDVNDVATFATITDMPSALPNPHTLIINGTAYDGSTAVDMTAVINTMIDAKLATIPNASGVSF